MISKQLSCDCPEVMSRHLHLPCVEDFDSRGASADVTYCPNSNFASARGSASADCGANACGNPSGTAIALLIHKRLDKDRIEIRTRRAKTLLHKQASKRPISPAASGASFFGRFPIATRRALCASKSCTGQLARGTAHEICRFRRLLPSLRSSPGPEARSPSRATAAIFPRSMDSVKAEAGQTYGKLSAVNGNVRVGRGATADEAKTVNGEIDVEDNAKLGEVSTVNGSLDIGDDVADRRATLRRSMAASRSANARASAATCPRCPAKSRSMAPKSAADRHAATATSNSPTARACAAAFTSRRTTAATGAGARTSPLKVHICSTCVVDGELRFDRPVELRVDDGREDRQGHRRLRSRAAEIAPSQRAAVQPHLGLVRAHGKHAFEAHA